MNKIRILFKRRLYFMINAKCPIQIEGQDYEIIVNVGKMIQVEENSGHSFMDAVKKAENGSIAAIASLLAECLTKDGESVGFEEIKGMNFDVFEELFEPLIETIVKAFPQKKKGDKKKVVVVLKTIK